MDPALCPVRKGNAPISDQVWMHDFQQRWQVMLVAIFPFKMLFENVHVNPIGDYVDG